MRVCVSVCISKWFLKMWALALKTKNPSTNGGQELLELTEVDLSKIVASAGRSPRRVTNFFFLFPFLASQLRLGLGFGRQSTLAGIAIATQSGHHGGRGGWRMFRQSIQRKALQVKSPKEIPRKPVDSTSASSFSSKTGQKSLFACFQSQFKRPVILLISRLCYCVSTRLCSLRPPNCYHDFFDPFRLRFIPTWQCCGVGRKDDCDSDCPQDTQTDKQQSTATWLRTRGATVGQPRSSQHRSIDQHRSTNGPQTVQHGKHTSTNCIYTFSNHCFWVYSLSLYVCVCVCVCVCDRRLLSVFEKKLQVLPIKWVYCPCPESRVTHFGRSIALDLHTHEANQSLVGYLDTYFNRSTTSRHPR